MIYLDLTVEKALEGDSRWVRNVVTKISKEEGTQNDSKRVFRRA